MRIFVAAIVLLSVFVPRAQAETLLFYVGIPQFPPVIFLDNEKESFSGIIPDIFDSMPEQDRPSVEYILHNRNRGENALYQNDVDATMLTVEWSTQPDKLVFSVPIFKHSDFLFDDKPFEKVETLAELVKGKSICARRGYTYPVLQAFFSNGTALRIDTSSEEAELKMLLRERCDLAVVNEYIAEWLMNNNQVGGDLYRHDYPLSHIDFTMAFTKEWQPFVEKLNAHIKHIRETGELEQIISKNRGTVPSDVGHSQVIAR